MGFDRDPSDHGVLHRRDLATSGVTAAARAAEDAARQSYGRLLAVLAARTDDIPAAEDALADAFERALRTWPTAGIPDNPEGWLVTVAKNRWLDERTRSPTESSESHTVDEAIRGRSAPKTGFRSLGMRQIVPRVSARNDNPDQGAGGVR